MTIWEQLQGGRQVEGRGSQIQWAPMAGFNIDERGPGKGGGQEIVRTTGTKAGQCFLNQGIGEMGQGIAAQEEIGLREGIAADVGGVEKMIFAVREQDAIVGDQSFDQVKTEIEFQRTGNGFQPAAVATPGIDEYLNP